MCNLSKCNKWQCYWSFFSDALIIPTLAAFTQRYYTIFIQVYAVKRESGIIQSSTPTLHWNIYVQSHNIIVRFLLKDTLDKLDTLCCKYTMTHSKGFGEIVQVGWSRIDRGGRYWCPRRCRNTLPPSPSPSLSPSPPGPPSPPLGLLRSKRNDERVGDLHINNTNKD